MENEESAQQELHLDFGDEANKELTQSADDVMDLDDVEQSFSQMSIDEDFINECVSKLNQTSERLQIEQQLAELDKSR